MIRHSGRARGWWRGFVLFSVWRTQVTALRRALRTVHRELARGRSVIVGVLIHLSPLCRPAAVIRTGSCAAACGESFFFTKSKFVLYDC